VDEQIIQLAQQLLRSGFEHFSERERRVITAIASRHHVTRNVNEALSERHTLRDRLSDQVAQFGGSWTFIAIFIGVLLSGLSLTRYRPRVISRSTHIHISFST